MNRGPQGPFLFSACLLGRRCRWDGGTCTRPEMQDLWKEAGGIEACPEELGGLPTPRSASTLVGGSGEDVLDGRARVVGSDGTDVTAGFVSGAERTLALARDGGIGRAYLKADSPSCGSRGVTAALLARDGIEIVDVP